MAKTFYIKDIVYTNDFVIKDDKTKNEVFRADIKLTKEDVAEIKAVFRKGEENISQADNELIYGILYKDKLQEMREIVGEHYLETISFDFLLDIMGKLEKGLMKSVKYHNTKYQSPMKK